MKKLTALFLVVLISIESFAAIVSDNDGSAFVTKTEFEGLKKDFAKQIENYEESIDKKIDGAIAAYLAGIKLTQIENIKLTSEINVAAGKGYRSYDISRLRERVTNVADWLFGCVVATCGSGNWMDISQGLVSEAKSTAGGVAIPTGYISVNGGNYTTADSQHMHATVTIGCVGTLYCNYGKTKPLMFASPDGTLSEFSNKRVLIVDTRYFRGNDSASGENRFIYALGNDSGTKQDTNYTFTFNNTRTLSAGKGGAEYRYAASGGGSVFPSIRAAKSEYTHNTNVFCWNVQNEDLGNVFSNDLVSAYTNIRQASSNVTTDSEGGMKLVRIVWAPDVWSGTASGRFGASVPEIHFKNLVQNTTLDSSCFETLSTTLDNNSDVYSRLYLKHLKVPDFKYQNQNLYIYQGLPLYSTTAIQNGTIKLNIKITKTTGSIWSDTKDTYVLRIQDEPFTMNDDYSKAISVKVGNESSKAPEITKDKKTSIEFEVKPNKTYFLRWFGKDLGYGGEITYLGDATFTPS